MQVLLNSRLIGFKEMIELGVLQNTEKLTSSMIKNRQESSLELMLEILHEILSHLNSVVRTDEDQIVEHIDEIFANFENCIQLLSLTFDTSIVEKSSQCLI